MIYELVLRNFWLQFWLCFFSAVTSAFQLFTRKLCVQLSGLRMRNFTWNRFPIKNLMIDSLLTPIVESTYLNRDMRKFESSQKDESRWQSTDSSKAYRNTSAFKCLAQRFLTFFLPRPLWVIVISVKPPLTINKFNKQMYILVNFFIKLSMLQSA